MEIQIEKISKKLKNLREERKLTQEELASHLGVSRQSIISLEQGRCLPSLPLAMGFSQIFELPFENIFCEEINQMRREVKHIMARDLSPWSPMQEITSLHEAIDRLFEDNFSPISKDVLPRVNVVEKTKTIQITADLPGVKEEDISIEVGSDFVTLSGERKSEKTEKEDNYYRQEVDYGSFTRTVPLPSVVNENKAEAILKDGTLVITIPKIQKAIPKVTKLKVKKG